MKPRWYTRLAPRNWPVAWKLSVASLLIFLAVQALITVVGNTLVRASLMSGQEQELLERAVQQADVVRTWRDELLKDLVEAAVESREHLRRGEQVLDLYGPVLYDQWQRLGDFSDWRGMESHRHGRLTGPAEAVSSRSTATSDLDP